MVPMMDPIYAIVATTLLNTVYVLLTYLLQEEEEPADVEIEW